MRDGSISVFLTLALCLAVPFGGIGIVAGMSLLTIAASRFTLIPRALRLYTTDWLRSEAFRLNLLILVVTLIEIGLVLYHHDGSGEFENQVKQYFMALAILLTLRRYPVEIVLWGAAVGCVLGGAVAIHDVYVLDLARAEGPTNAIRFGMIAALLSVFAWIGVLFGRVSKSARLFMAIAAAAGILAVFLSGSRGAVIAIPIMLLSLIPKIWRWSRSAALLSAAIFILFSMSLGLWQVNLVRAGFSNVTTIVQALATGHDVGEHSARDRITMLRMAVGLFAAHPVAGVGAVGWDLAVAEQMRTSPPGAALSTRFNQPHNQYANDFVKGGLLRGLGGLAMLALPLVYFLRRHPFKLRRRSLAPLLGVVTCLAYAVFSLTESVMDLSLTASIYVILIFYLIAASEGPPMAHVGKAGRPPG
jgi:O-antigen ligase